MGNDWQIVETRLLSPEAIMAKDSFLLQQLEVIKKPVLHFYEWDTSCFTYGYFTDPSIYLNLEFLNNFKLGKARRPTGGGIIFHLSDFAFSVLIPASHPHFSLNTLDNYALINRKVAEAITYDTKYAIQPTLFTQKTNPMSQNKNPDCQAFCMANLTQFDLIFNGKKMCGAAQRRTKYGFLHQATFSLYFPPSHLLTSLLKNHFVILEAMKKYTYCFLSQTPTPQYLQEVRIHLQNLLKEYLTSI